MKDVGAWGSTTINNHQSTIINQQPSTINNHHQPLEGNLHSTTISFILVSSWPGQLLAIPGNLITGYLSKRRYPQREEHAAWSRDIKGSNRSSYSNLSIFDTFAMPWFQDVPSSMNFCQRWGGGPLYLLRRLASSSVHFHGEPCGIDTAFRRNLGTLERCPSPRSWWPWVLLWPRRFHCGSNAAMAAIPIRRFHDISHGFCHVLSILLPIYDEIIWNPSLGPDAELSAGLVPVSGAAVLVHCSDSRHLTSAFNAVNDPEWFSTENLLLVLSREFSGMIHNNYQ